METVKIKLIKIITGCSLVVVTFFVSCTNQKKDSSGDQSVNTEVTDAREIARKELENDLDKILKKADEDLDILNARLVDASEDTKQQIEKAIEELKKERQKIAQNIKDVEEASEDTWIDVKGEVEESLENASLKIDSLVKSV